MLESMLDSIIAGSMDPFVGLASSARRVFLPFLGGALLLSSLVWAVKLRHKCSLWAFLFPRAVWLHRSALLDYKLMLVRAVLSATLLAPFVISSVLVAYEISRLLHTGFGLGPWQTASPATVAAFFTVTGFLAEDFARYMVHRLAHRVPVLWELHKVHHSAEVLTPFTVYRTHPLESVLMRAGAATGVGVAAGLASWLFRGRVSAWDILGVHALSFVWNMLGSNLRHSHVWISYGRALEHVLISPAQHQIHHSDDPRHHDRNFGSALAIWDFLGRSLYVPRCRERIRFGLPPEDRNHGDSVLSILLAPLAGALRALLPKRETRAVRSA